MKKLIQGYNECWSDNQVNGRKSKIPTEIIIHGSQVTGILNYIIFYMLGGLLLPVE